MSRRGVPISLLLAVLSLVTCSVGAGSAQAAPTATIASTGGISYVLTVTGSRPLAWFQTQGLPGAANIRPTAPVCSTKQVAPSGSAEIYCAFGSTPIPAGTPARVCFEDAQGIPKGASMLVSDLSVQESASITSAPAVAGCPIGSALPLLAGAVKCVVPNVKGKKLVAAEKAIAKAHCAVGKIKRVRSKHVRRGKVVTQRPGAGRLLAPGAKVALTVSKG